MHSNDLSLQSYLNSIGDEPLLTRKEEQYLAARSQKGDLKAINTLITRNLRLVIKIAKDFNFGHVDMMDLISEGNIGLQKAAERYMPGMNSKFSTYAVWWIRQTISRALTNQSRQIRIPVHMVDTQGKILRLKRHMEAETGQVPTNEEIAEVTGIDVKRIEFIVASMVTTVSLQTPLAGAEGEIGESTLGDFIEDTKTEAPYEQMQQKTYAEAVVQILATLNPRERRVIERRYGLFGQSEVTLEKVSDEYGLTRERIRQIQEKTLRKLRQRMHKLPGAPKELKDILRNS